MKRLPSWISVLPSLVVPVSIGLSLYLGLQYLIDTQVIVDETVLRYLTGHAVSKITVAMFLVGIASLLVLGWNLIGQFSGEAKISLGEATDATANQDAREQAVDHGQFLLDLPNRYHSHYLWDRLVAAVHSIYRTGSTASVEDELKYLSDMEQERQQQRYSLVRILIWATPMLGFLGTVLGISQALGGIAIGPENDFQQMMNGLRGSLYIAFDTTALALTLSMLMMFGLFLIERFDSQLLRLVDQRAHSEIAKHYEIMSGGSFDSAQLVQAIQGAVVNQTEIWRESIRKAEQAWTSTLTQTSDIVRGQLSESLDENIAALAHYLGESIEKADMSISHRWSQWQVSLSENARLMEQHLMTLGIQTKSVERIVNSLDESTAFDQAMKHQQDAVMATTRTHQVLNELLDKVQEANLAERAYEPAAHSHAQSKLLMAAGSEIGVGRAAGFAGQTAEALPVSVPFSDQVVDEQAPVADPIVEQQPAAIVADAEAEFVSETSTQDDERTLVLVFSEDEAETLQETELVEIDFQKAEPVEADLQKAEPVEVDLQKAEPVQADLQKSEPQVSESPVVEQHKTEQQQLQPVAELPRMKIFEAEQAKEEKDFSSLLVDTANKLEAAPAKVVVPQPIAVSPKPKATVPQPKANLSRSAKIARALTEDPSGETDEPSVAFRARIQKPDSENGKRAA